ETDGGVARGPLRLLSAHPDAIIRGCCQRRNLAFLRQLESRVSGEGGIMTDKSRFLWLGAGLLLGIAGTALYLNSPKLAYAANDRFDDYILCTGPVAFQPLGDVDGVWMIDYKAGKLLGTVIDRTLGKIVSWAEVDLLTEFGLQPKQNVHFLMTTGAVTRGQAALYVAETSTGRFGVYTMGPRPDNRPGLAIRRHDMVLFRQPAGGG